MRDNQNLFSAVAVSALAVMFLFSAPTAARAVTTNLNAGESINLATVIDNNLSVWIGDKVFEDFDFTYLDINSPDAALAPSNVNVKALGGLIGFGLEFQQPLFTVGGPTIKDIIFEYSVTVTNSANLISGIRLAITGSSANGGVGTVGENASVLGFGGDVIGHLEAHLSGPLSSVTNLDYAVAKIYVQKDVGVRSFGPTSFASISIIDQRFEQIPEPSTIFLVGLGLLGVVALNRKRKS